MMGSNRSRRSRGGGNVDKPGLAPLGRLFLVQSAVGKCPSLSTLCTFLSLWTGFASLLYHFFGAAGSGGSPPKAVFFAVLSILRALIHAYAAQEAVEDVDKPTLLRVLRGVGRGQMGGKGGGQRGRGQKGWRRFASLAWARRLPRPYFSVICRRMSASMLRSSRFWAISSEMVRQACSTVVWSRPPKALPMSDSDRSVNSRTRYMANFLG